MNVPADPNRRHELKMELHDVALAAFAKAARQRSKRAHTEWAAFELGAVRDAVNKHIRRRKAGLVVDDAAVAYADQRAYGHSDYGHKFALYVAEAAVGMAPAAR